MMIGYYSDILSTQRSKIDREYSLDQSEDRWLYYYMEFQRFSLDKLNAISEVTLEIFPASHGDKIIEFWVLASHRERIEFAIYFSSEPVRIQRQNY